MTILICFKIYYPSVCEDRRDFVEFKMKNKMKDVEMFNEVWKDIPSMEGIYQASTKGRIRSVDRNVKQFGHKREYVRLMRGKIIKPRIQNGGYYVVWLSRNGEIKPHTVHRIIAKTFIPNPEGKNDVNHKDGNRLNNEVCNLEWNTRSENILHSYNILKRHPSKSVAVECVETGKTFESVKEAERSLGLCVGSISQVVNGYNKTAGGLRWRKI